MQSALNKCRSSLVGMAPLLVTNTKQSSSKRRSISKRLKRNSTKTYYAADSDTYQTYARKFKHRNVFRKHKVNKPELMRNNLKRSILNNELPDETDRIYCSISQLAQPDLKSFSQNFENYLNPNETCVRVPLKFQPKFSSTPVIKPMLATSTPKIYAHERKCYGSCCKSLAYDFEEYNYPFFESNQNFNELPKQFSTTYYNIHSITSMNPITSTPYKLYFNNKKENKDRFTTSTSTLTTVVNCCIKPLRKLLNKKLARKKLQIV